MLIQNIDQTSNSQMAPCIPPSRACASYQIPKCTCCACARNAGNVFPRHWLQRKPLVSDPGMHHGTCVTHMPWCMSGLRTHSGRENVPGIPGTCATHNFMYLVRGPCSGMSFENILERSEHIISPQFFLQWNDIILYKEDNHLCKLCTSSELLFL